MTRSELPSAPRLPTRSRDRRRSAARARGLTRETILDAALAIVDTEGLDALTMRTVARSLGTGAASLYAYVSGKEELLELLIDRVLGEVGELPVPDLELWQEQIKELVRRVRATFARHRDLARASFTRIPVGENALRGSESMLGVLLAGGLPAQAAAYAVDLLALYATAIAYEDSLWTREQVTPEQMRDYVESLRDYFASLPVDRFPVIAALAGPLTAGGDSDERFEFGLEVLVRGLAALAAVS